jgi:hypothetical protein
VTMSGAPSCAISTAWAWRSWCGAKRRRTPAVAAVRRSSARAAAGDHGRPRVGPLMTQNNGPTGSSRRTSIQRCRCSQAHSSHADLAASMAPVTGRAHDGDDLLDGRRVGRIAVSLVTWRAAGMESRHGRRRPPTTGGVEQQLTHGPSSGLEESRASRKDHRGKPRARAQNPSAAWRASDSAVLRFGASESHGGCCGKPAGVFAPGRRPLMVFRQRAEAARPPCQAATALSRRC